MGKLNYNQMIISENNAGFEEYVNTKNDNDIKGTILTNTLVDSPYSGEVLEIFEDCSFNHYTQFKSQPVLFHF